MVEKWFRISKPESLFHICKTYLFILILTAALAAPLLISPIAEGHTPPQSIPTFAFVAPKPNLVGVNQQVIVEFGLDQAPPTANATGGDRWTNFMVRLTRPDGTVENKGPFTSNETGRSYFLYNPTMTGTYSFMLSFPGQILSKYNPINGLLGVDSEYVNDTFQASNAHTTLIVQQAPVGSTTPTPSTSPQPTTVQTTAAVFVLPNPVGVGQTVRITMSIEPAPASGAFDGLVLTITKPDGVIENLGPFYSNQTGFFIKDYMPTMLGTYHLQLMYPGQFFAESNTRYLSASSTRAEFRVQQQPVTTEIPSPVLTATPVPTPTYEPNSPTLTPVYTLTPEPTVTQVPVETNSQNTPMPPSPTSTGSQTSALGIVLQTDKPTPQALYLSPATIGTVVIVAIIVGIVVVMFRRLFGAGGGQKLT